MTGQIRLLGRRSDVNVLMKRASVLLLTSQKEGMPNVVMEAQLMGIPVVATDAGGTRDTVIEGRTAILAPVAMSRHWRRLSPDCCSIRPTPSAWAMRVARTCSPPIRNGNGRTLSGCGPWHDTTLRCAANVVGKAS